MGCTVSKVPADDAEGYKKSQKIDDQLKSERNEAKSEVKMLLLGAGESGKSTLVKQMRLMYSTPWTAAERNSYREVVYLNTIQSMQAVIHGFEALDMDIPEDIQMDVDFLLDLEKNPPILHDLSAFSPEMAAPIQRLWNTKVIRDVIDQSSKFQLNDSAIYFFEAIDRMVVRPYVPTDDDILRVRVRSTGIAEEKFQVKSYVLRVFDVGGQRSERKKWIHCFENVEVLVFVIALSEYDQTLWEDNSINRMDEAMMLFESITSSRWFYKSTFVLLLNKIDLFKSKLLVSPLEKVHPEYTGGPNYAAAAEFMQNKILAVDRRRDSTRNSGKGGNLYTHLTCATDTSQVHFVIAAMMDSLLSGLLSDVGLL